MRILGIETSCDETGIALIETPGIFAIHEKAPITVLADMLISQIDIHKEYGGVFPSLARREHAKNILPLLLQALETAGFLSLRETPRVLNAEETAHLDTIFHKEPALHEAFKETLLRYETPEIDCIAVTSGPGLEPALWVGINTAQALSMLWGVPLIPINHMEGHIMASLLTEEQKKPRTLTLSEPLYPSLALLVSGGHTELVLMKEAGTYELLGQTRDDAVGEAFDKVARMLGLPYPGGPEISKLAETATHGTTPPYPLPRPMLKSGDYDFSFAGLKTAVLYTIKDIPELTPEIKASIAKEFEDAVTEILITKTRAAALEHGVREIILGGGVTANKKLREAFTSMVAQDLQGTTLHIPARELSTDNGLMIAIAGLLKTPHPPQETSLTIRAQGTMRLT